MKLSNVNGSEITNFNFNSTDWDTPKTIEVSNSNPLDLGLINLSITSDDVNYHGTGITLGINDGELVAQRNALSQAHIPAFKSNTSSKEILLSSSKSLSESFSSLNKESIPESNIS